MRIECTQGCGAMLNVKLPAHPDTVIIGPGTFSVPESEAEQLAQIRAESDRAVGHAITEAVVAHMLFDCPTAAAADADCGATSPMGYRCNLQTKHDGEHKHQIDDDDGTHTIATWPNLTAVQP